MTSDEALMLEFQGGSRAAFEEHKTQELMKMAS
jgi:hypothetical protein